MTRINLEALETLLSAGTQGEWRHVHHGVCEIEAGENRLVADCGARELGGHADANAIVALRNAAPALIAEIRALREVAAAARSLCQADSDMSNESRGTRRARLSREEPNRWGALRGALAKVRP